jgi:hypothetical protein
MFHDTASTSSATSRPFQKNPLFTQSDNCRFCVTTDLYEEAEKQAKVFMFLLYSSERGFSGFATLNKN